MKLHFTPLFLVLIAPAAVAQWSDDPAVNLAVSDASADQVQPMIAPTADGGCYISWFDSIANGFDVRLDCSNDRYINDRAFDVVEAFVAAARERGVTPAQLALAWVMGEPRITAPIIGASRLEQLDDAIGAVDVELSDGDVAALEEVYEPHAIAGHE